MFERILHKQISAYIEFYLSPYLCGYRKGYCAQYAIITMLEKWKTAVDEKGMGVLSLWIYLKPLILLIMSY